LTRYSETIIAENGVKEQVLAMERLPEKRLVRFYGVYG